MKYRWNSLDRLEKKYVVMIVISAVIICVSMFLLSYLVVNGWSEVDRLYESRAEAEQWQYIMDNTDCAGQAVYYKNYKGEWIYMGLCEYITHSQDAGGTVWYDIKWPHIEGILAHKQEGTVKIDSIVGPVLPVGIDGEAY